MHLEDNPLDVSILVQAGNCLKEAGEYKQAEKRYRAALDIDPNNSDTHLQYGHLMKQMGRPLEAIESYKRSAERDPSNQDAILELIAAGAAGDVFGLSEEESQTNTIWLDVTDLMEYASVNKSLSGIQRVVSNLCSMSPRAPSRAIARFLLSLNMIGIVYWPRAPPRLQRWFVNSTLRSTTAR